jgi:hypothetical protein
MWKLVLFLFPLLPASAQSSLSLGLGAFAYDLALPSGYWGGVSLRSGPVWGLRAYARREGRFLGLPASYYGGLWTEYVNATEYFGSNLLYLNTFMGTEIYLGNDHWALFGESWYPLYVWGPGPSSFGFPGAFGLRYYFSGREAYTATDLLNAPLKLYFLASPVRLALAYEPEARSFWLSPYPLAFGGHGYWGGFLLGAGMAFWDWGRAQPYLYLGYRFRLGKAVEAHIRLEGPWAVPYKNTFLYLPLPSFALVFPL